MSERRQSFMARALPWCAAAFLGLAPATAWAQVATVSGDTTLSQANPAMNFGTLGTLSVNAQSSAIVRFDLSALPPGLTAANIQKATLTVYVDKVLVAGGLDFMPLTQPWTEMTATFNSYNPGLAGPAFQINVPVSGAGFVTVDITNLLVEWLTGVQLNNGIIIRPALAQPATSLILDSKESTTTSQPAFLSVMLASQGPTGPTGASGAAGPAGPSGATGVAGQVGATGATGVAGTQGPSGATGVAGPVGPSGATGVAGPAGASGASGPAGAKGATGAAGPSGPLGPAGTTGPSGPAGVAGAAGPSGPLGPAGASGPSGPQGTAGAAGPSGPLGPAGASGPSGPQGTAGAAGPSGPLGPAGATGPSGPQGTAGAAGPSGPLGPAGATGPSGPQGTAGAAGPSGPLGPAGATGPSGPQGTAGAAGPSGPLGPAGATGPSGPAGVAGPGGPSGPSGAQGNTGSTGAAGATGPSGPAGPNGAGVFGTGFINPTNTTPFYLTLNGNQLYTTNNPEFTGISMPVACSFDTLQVTLFAVTGGTQDNIGVTLVKNGIDQGLSCTATSSASAGGISSCSDGSPLVAVVAGDIVGLHVTQTTSTPGVRVAIGTRCR